jgi:glycosyltransferase involved in cell wall biosynthesis/SAM-dependent methyltransferase
MVTEVFTLKQRYDSENATVFASIPTNIASLLDVGCGTGTLMKRVRLDMGSQVHLEGVTYSEEEAALAAQYADTVWNGDLNDFDFDLLGLFDCIVCSHILEHLNWPERVLASLKEHLTPEGCLIVALPNVLQFKSRWAFLRGRFRYTDQGVMDRTHFRFFDWHSARQLIGGAGLEIQSAHTPGHFPLPAIRKYARPMATGIDKIVSAKWPGLFAMQFVFQCREASLASARRPVSTAYRRERDAVPVSVVLTTYNRADLVGKTIDSILRQTFRDFELIICDDCSPDSTEQVCAEYVRRDSRVRYIRNAANLGMPGNLNAGIQAASGTYIANLHDGDLYHSTLLEKWKKALDEAPEAAFVFNEYRIVDASGSEVKIYRGAFPASFPGSLLIEEYFRRWRFDSPVYGTAMGRRSAYSETGLFDPRFKFIADVDMWLRLAERYHVAFVPEPLIDIPARDVLASNWQGWQFTPEHRLLRQIMWEARNRHYRRRPVQRTFEAIRHACFSLAIQGFLILAKAKHGSRRVLQRVSTRTV